MLTTMMVVPASAHGSISDPPSRNYGCWLRWGSDFQNPAMAQQDPMCWQAWQNNTNAMWNWNGLYREGVAGNHQAAIPDGQLCSGGLTESGRYASMDVPGAWKTVDRPARFTMNLMDQASHGADYIRVYVTRQGYDPKTQRRVHRPRAGDVPRRVLGARVLPARPGGVRTAPAPPDRDADHHPAA
ncbi:lytic polysaccharide monooxygenase [Streptosporangium sp. NPDC001682]